MTLKTLAAAACLSLSMATASFAASVDFNFSFTNGTNTITGLIEGLDSDGLGQAASTITVQGVFDTYVFANGSFSANTFDVSGSVVTISTASASSSARTSSGNRGGIDFNGPLGSFRFNERGSNRARAFTKAGSITFTPVSAVPLPAGGLLLLSGLGGVAALKRRKKRAA